jgi:hypothetical protein
VTFAVGAPLALTMLGFFFMKETPLFLLSRRKFRRFKKVIRYTAKVNKKGK